MTLAVVELSQIVEVIWVSLIAGIVITTSYSLVVYGTSRVSESRRVGRRAAAFGFGTLAAVCLLIFVATLVLGVHTMLSKG